MGLFSKVKENLLFGPNREELDTADSSWGRPQKGISAKLVVLGILGLMLFIAARIWGGTGVDLPTKPEIHLPESAIKVNDPVPEGNLTGLQQYEEFLSAQLAEILTEVQGAGDVAVYVSLASGPEYDYAQNRSVESRTTEERDTGGGQRVIHETREDNQLVMAASIQGTRNEGLVRKELHPPVQGVLIVATGADNSQVKVQLIQAAQVALGIGSHQVVVLPKER
jgi:stage III sporulation protein AG